MNYRPDIEGLRAIAVIPVILFHADISAFSGGYVGVDIFFVISGYLITGIILEDIQQKKFSLLTFYKRRIRRIFPALFTVVSLSSCFALWIMFSSEFESYGKSLLAATLFYSNYHFMFDTGYFTVPAESNPLLHTWSLAVEEQFYIIFPIYLYLVSRYFPKKFNIIFITILVVSFIYSIITVYMSPGDAFFSTPSRAWELMTGSLLAIFPRKAPINIRTSNMLTLIGIGSILYSIQFYTKETPFPGTMALLPVIGSALIIYCGNSSKNIIGILLSTKLFRFPGLLSYSLYLWHWPVFVFYKMYALGPITSSEVIMMIGVTISLSYLSWKFIEIPFRKRKIISNQKTMLFAVSAILFSVIFSVIVIINDGIPTRHSKEINKILAVKTDSPNNTNCEIVNVKSGNSLRTCQIGAVTTNNPTFAVWGDSHGEAILPGISASAEKHNVKGVYIGRGGCLPLLDAHQVRQGYEKCVDIADTFIDFLIAHPEINKIILASRWAIYAEGDRFKNEKGHTVYIKDSQTPSLSLKENRKVFARSMNKTFKELSKLDRKIILLMQIPETEWNIPIDTARAVLLNRNIEFRPKLSDYIERQNFVQEEAQNHIYKYNIELLQPHKEMCIGSYCKVSNNGIPIYRDTNHITNTYAKELSGMFDTIFTP